MGLDTSRVLRVGVVFRGAILAERVLNRRVDVVTVGTRADSTVQIGHNEHPDFPASLTLAILRNGAYYMPLPDDQGAHVNLRGGPAGSQGAVAGQVVKIDGKRCAAIDAYTGGSVAFGDVILMFQFVRADAVPTVTREETVIRLGLVHEQRLLTDRVFPAGREITVGCQTRDSIVLPEEDYRGTSARFRVRKDNKVVATLPAEAQLRLATDGLPMDQDEALRKGVARRDGNQVEIELGLRARGRISLGAYTLLFQVIRQTTTVPLMARRTVFGQLAAPLVAEPIWSLSIILSFVLLGSLVGQAVIFQASTGRYLKSQWGEEIISNTTYDVIIEEREQAKEEEKKNVQDIKSDAARKAEEDELKKQMEAEKKKKQQVPVQSLGRTLSDEEKQRQARQAVMKNTIAGAFGRGGATTKLFAEADGDGSGDGTVVARTFGGGGGGEGEGGGPEGLRLTTAGVGGTMEVVRAGKGAGFGKRDAAQTKVIAQKEEAKVEINLMAGGLEGGEGTSKAEVARVISRKNSAIQRCYEMALRADPNLTGKVTVRFVVGTAGTVTGVTVLGATGAFEACIKGKFLNIRGLPLLPSQQSFTQSYVFTKS